MNATIIKSIEAELKLAAKEGCKEVVEDRKKELARAYDSFKPGYTHTIVEDKAWGFVVECRRDQDT